MSILTSPTSTKWEPCCEAMAEVYGHYGLLQWAREFSGSTGGEIVGLFMCSAHPYEYSEYTSGIDYEIEGRPLVVCPWCQKPIEKPVEEGRS